MLPYRTRDVYNSRACVGRLLELVSPSDNDRLITKISFLNMGQEELFFQIFSVDLPVITRKIIFVQTHLGITSRQGGVVKKKKSKNRRASRLRAVESCTPQGKELFLNDNPLVSTSLAPARSCTMHTRRHNHCWTKVVCSKTPNSSLRRRVVLSHGTGLGVKAKTCNVFYTFFCHVGNFGDVYKAFIRASAHVPGRGKKKKLG